MKISAGKLAGMKAVSDDRGVIGAAAMDQRGSLLELTWNGRDPLDLPTGKRTFLEDGDEVTLTAWAPGPGGTRVGLGEVTGRVRARD